MLCCNRISEIKLDHLVISLWAATPEMYAKTHPNKAANDFLRIKHFLALLNERKNRYPRVRIYNVISNLNYHELIQMAEFARETRSECVEFTVVDTMPERTDRLLLNSEQAKEILTMCRELQQDKRYYTGDGKFLISNFDQFVRRVSSEYSSEAEYDRDYLDDIPCYVGWLFARIIADGNVNSCLKSHRIPIGNLYEQDFADIWNGSKQRDFRKCMTGASKDFRILSMIGNDPKKATGCYKSCDDLGRNILMHEKILKLNPLQKKLLQRAAKIKRMQKMLFSHAA